MDQNDFRTLQFTSLRREIDSLQTRGFWVVFVGLLGTPPLSHFLLNASTPVWLTLPFFLLGLIVLFLAQQHHMMRAGRYIRENIEKATVSEIGWEEWLESRPELRLFDRHSSACFMIIFFAYYFLAIGLAMHRLVIEAADDPSGIYMYGVYGAAIVYLIATIWAFGTLFHYWKSSMSTTIDVAKITPKQN